MDLLQDPPFKELPELLSVEVQTEVEWPDFQVTEESPELMAVEVQTEVEQPGHNVSSSSDVYTLYDRKN